MWRARRRQREDEGVDPGNEEARMLARVVRGASPFASFVRVYIHIYMYSSAVYIYITTNQQCTHEEELNLQPRGVKNKINIKRKRKEKNRRKKERLERGIKEKD